MIKLETTLKNFVDSTGFSIKHQADLGLLFNVYLDDDGAISVSSSILELISNDEERAAFSEAVKLFTFNQYEAMSSNAVSNYADFIGDYFYNNRDS